jgi:hypothetical protein
MCSKGATSRTSVAPPLSQSGRPARNRSSITHWENGSVTTQASSRRPSRLATVSRSASVTAGTMRSTIALGQSISASIHAARPGSRNAANWRTTRRVAAPLSGRLSQLSRASPPAPAARRAASPATINPGAERGGPCPSRSARMSGCVSSRSPCAGSRQYPFSVTVSVTIRVAGRAIAATASPNRAGPIVSRSVALMVRTGLSAPRTRTEKSPS